MTDTEQSIICTDMGARWVFWSLPATSNARYIHTIQREESRESPYVAVEVEAQANPYQELSAWWRNFRRQVKWRSKLNYPHPPLQPLSPHLPPPPRVPPTIPVSHFVALLKIVAPDPALSNFGSIMAGEIIATLSKQCRQMGISQSNQDAQLEKGRWYKNHGKTKCLVFLLLPKKRNQCV